MATTAAPVSGRRALNNQARFLAEAVRSASARTVRFELIVVDDGSTDHSAAVARALRDVLLIRQHNRGLSGARNRGMRAASGEFVIFLDADDRLLPGAIDLGARALGAHPDCVMAYGRTVMMSADGQLWPAPDVPVVRSGYPPCCRRISSGCRPRRSTIKPQSPRRALRQRHRRHTISSSIVARPRTITGRSSPPIDGMTGR